MGFGATLTIFMEGEQLMVQLTGQQTFPIFAESEDRFFWRIVDAQVEFTRDETGEVAGLVLSQGGQSITIVAFHAH